MAALGVEKASVAIEQDDMCGNRAGRHVWQSSRTTCVGRVWRVTRQGVPVITPISLTLTLILALTLTFDRTLTLTLTLARTLTLTLDRTLTLTLTRESNELF